MQRKEALGQINESELDVAVNSAIELIDGDGLTEEIGRFLDLLKSQYKECDANAGEFSFIGEVDAVKAEKLTENLLFTNYTPNSLIGEVVVLFDTPLFVSEIKTSLVLADKKPGDAIRLISYAGMDKKVSSNPRPFRRINGLPDSVFDVYGLVWGFILPKSLSFKSVSCINFKHLFEGRGSLEALSDSRDKLRDVALDYKKKTEKSMRIIGEGVNVLTNEYIEIKNSTTIQLDERARVSESLEEIKEIKARVEIELGVANKKLASSEEKLRQTISNIADSVNELTQVKSDVIEGTNELNNISTKIELEQANLEKRQAQVRKSQSEIDTYSLDMNGFSKASRMHVWVCYIVLAGLLSSLSNIFFIIYGNASGLMKHVDSSAGKVSVLDILLSRLPSITATTLIFVTLSTLLFFLVKHVIALHTDKMNMLKASILTEQVTYSLDCANMTEAEVKELKRKSKIELLVKIFGFNGASSSSSSAVDDNRQIDLITKVVEALKPKS